MTLRFIGPFGILTNEIIVYFTVAFLYYSILFCFQSSILGEEREEDAGKRENREKDHGKGKRVELSWFWRNIGFDEQKRKMERKYSESE